MKLRDTRKNWDRFGKTDPFYAILSEKDKSGGRWNKAEFFKTGEKEISDALGYIASKNLPLRHARALDFGCAVGRLTQALAPHFEEVIGVDIAASMIKLARKHNRYRTKCKYFLNKEDDLKLFPDNHFDFIYSNIVLQHMEPQYAGKYIREFVRVLTPEGVLLFQIPSRQLKFYPQAPSLRTKIKRFLPPSLLNLYRRIKHFFKPVLEMHGISKEKVVSILTQSGAQVLNIKENTAPDRSWESFMYLATKK
jgi:2-polyprenyl-3-methyl-5-hydroxy-6-metoxy-1,4-benzoquinol methylase